MTECRDTSKGSVENGLSGWSFVLSSIGVFLVPLVLGVTAAALAGGSDVHRFLSGAAGLVCGMIISASTYTIFSHSSRKKESDSQ